MFDPRTHILGVLLALVALFFYSRISLLALMLFILIGFYLFQKEGRKALRGLAKNMLPLGLFILLLWPLFTPSEAPFFSWAFIKIGWDNIRSSTLMVLRLFNIVLLCSYPMVALERSTLIQAMVKMGMPYHWAFTLVLAMQSVPDFTNRWQKIRLARQARGLDPDKGGLLYRLSHLIPLLAAVIVSALRDSEQLSYALINRGLDRAGERSWLEHIRFRLRDVLFLFCLTLILLCFIMFL
ncbi:MAG: energy-coupling factor transporter transmembrane component T [Spirochaetales bacterium]|nr:energy-coupling factor transporter transmembrane component T [Spirochaetales bacterium]